MGDRGHNRHGSKRSYISAISKPIHLWVSPKYLLFKGYKVSYNRNAPHFWSNFEILNLNPKDWGGGSAPFWGGGWVPI